MQARTMAWPPSSLFVVPGASACLHVLVAYFAQDRDCQQCGHSIEYGNDNEYRGPAAGRLLEEGKGDGSGRTTLPYFKIQVIRVIGVHPLLS
jgi:hypothetical protein